MQEWQPRESIRPRKAPSALHRQPGRAFHRAARQGTVHVFITLSAAFACWALWQDEVAEANGEAVAFVLSNLMKQMVICLVALLGGLTLYFAGGPETPSILMIYFGAQTGMNLFMKNVLSKIVVDEEEGLKGIPMGFLLTAIQQAVAAVAFACFWIAGRVLQLGYKVKTLEANEYASVFFFGLAFALNIGLNNFSLSLVAISINMIIRSCLPLSTAILQASVSAFMGKQRQSTLGPKQWVLMLAGVSCAGIASYAKSHTNTEESAALSLGISITVASIFAGALNMVMASVIKLNPLDTTCYMALPAGILLLIPSLVWPHPVSQWPNHDSMTDWQILQEVMSKNPSVLIPVLISGVLSFFYNILQYTMVHKLSPTHATLAGNFNKAATIALSLTLGLESTPAGKYGQIFVLAILGNIAAFTMFSMSKGK